MRLRGLRVVVTRSAVQAAGLRRPLEAAGAQVLVRPLIRIAEAAGPDRLAAAVRSIRDYDWVVFTSSNAADRFIGVLETAGADAVDVAAVRVAAVGPATATALEAAGIRVDILPGEHLAAALAEALAARTDLDGARVLWPRARGAGLELARALEQHGATVDDVETYRTIPDVAAGAALRDELAGGSIDVLTFASASAVRAFAPRTMAWSVPACVAVIGPVTAAEASRRGVPVHVQATEHTAEGLVAVLEAYFANPAGSTRDPTPSDVRRAGTTGSTSPRAGHHGEGPNVMNGNQTQVETKAPAAFAALLERIERAEASSAVVGLGYVGLPLALEVARSGYRVLGYDVSDDVVATINAGCAHIRDVKAAAVAELVDGGQFSATRDAARLAECDVISVCVPTPLSKTRDPDVSYVVAATEAVAAVLRPGQLVILESTTYPGTTRELMLPMLEAGGLRVGHDFFVCFSPERVDPGNPHWGIRNTPKVIGGITDRCTAAGAAFYGRVMDRVVTVSSTEAAELTKLLENTFRAVNIALVNEITQAADRLNVDVFEVIQAAATKPFGFMKFMPGPGIGGHCIPLDPHYLAWKMRTLNYKARLIELAGEVNSEMPLFVVNKISDALNERRKALRGSRVLVLGVAYKRDTDDIRESPALDIMRLLEAKGTEVAYHDPYVAEVHEDGIVRHSVPFEPQELETYDCILIATDHSAIDYEPLALLECPVVDTRNAMGDLNAGNVVRLSGATSPVGAETTWAGASRG